MGQDARHTGIITGISQGRLTVSIDNQPDCDGCAISAICDVSDRTEITIESRNADLFTEGERVKITATDSTQRRAILWAFAVPLLLFLAIVFISSPVALVSVAVYYCILYISRDRLQGSLNWVITKTEGDET